MVKSMNKRGFTFIELLAVILIIGVLMAIAVPGIMSLSNKMKVRGLDSKIEAIEEAAVNYAQGNSNKLKNEIKSKNHITKCDRAIDGVCECDKYESSSDTYTDCKYIYKMTVDDLIKEGAYKSENPDSEDDVCDVPDPTSNKCLDCSVIEIKIDDDYKSSTAKIDKNAIGTDTTCE